MKEFLGFAKVGLRYLSLYSVTFIPKVNFLVSQLDALVVKEMLMWYFHSGWSEIPMSPSTFDLDQYDLCSLCPLGDTLW